MNLRQICLDATVVLFVFAAATPGFCQNNDAPRLPGATNGTIGPKSGIETPLESKLFGVFPFQPAPFGKGRIENPLERSLNDIKPVATATPAPQSSLNLRPIPARSIAQRKERPGLVSWHENFKQACAASAQSGKPVLLVHVLGNLDEHFC